MARHAARTRSFPGRSRPRVQASRYSGRAFSAVRPIWPPCRTLCRVTGQGRTSSANPSPRVTELTPLQWNRSRASMAQVWRVGISGRLSSPLGRCIGAQRRDGGGRRAKPEGGAAPSSTRTGVRPTSPQGEKDKTKRLSLSPLSVFGGEVPRSGGEGVREKLATQQCSPPFPKASLPPDSLRGLLRVESTRITPPAPGTRPGERHKARGRTHPDTARPCKSSW